MRTAICARMSADEQRNLSVRRTVFALVLSGCAFHSGPWTMPSHQLTQVEYTNDRNYCLDQSFTAPIPAPFPPPRWSMMAPPETSAFNRCMRAQGYVEMPSGAETK
jgi:hypothetical protein